LQRSQSQGTGKKGKGRAAAAKAPKSRAVLTLKDLLDQGIIFPGQNKISVVYKGHTYKAALTKDGKILYEGAPVLDLPSPASSQCRNAVKKMWELTIVRH
jgi:Restriction Enzyme Adenine Methylase Associated